MPPGLIFGHPVKYYNLVGSIPRFVSASRHKCLYKFYASPYGPSRYRHGPSTPWCCGLPLALLKSLFVYRQTDRYFTNNLISYYGENTVAGSLHQMLQLHANIANSPFPFMPWLPFRAARNLSSSQTGWHCFLYCLSSTCQYRDVSSCRSLCMDRR